MILENNNLYEAMSFDGLEADSFRLEQADFVTCQFKSCQFSEAHFTRCSFRNCAFEDCSLDLMHVARSVLKSCQFTRCKLMGVNWTEASWDWHEMAQLIKSINFQECLLNYDIFMDLKLKGMEMIDCIALEVDFSNANLSKAVFRGTDLQRAIFRNTDCREADFRGAKNYAISAQVNNISKAHFSLPEAMALLYTMDIKLDE
jgi:fluoroquinolone resistance protein